MFLIRQHLKPRNPRIALSEWKVASQQFPNSEVDAGRQKQILLFEFYTVFFKHSIHLFFAVAEQRQNSNDFVCHRHRDVWHLKCLCGNGNDLSHWGDHWSRFLGHWIRALAWLDFGCARNLGTRLRVCIVCNWESNLHVWRLRYVGWEIHVLDCACQLFSHNHRIKSVPFFVISNNAGVRM